eukprot:12081839-Alexandrium_andersonii.AAC.1
MRRVSELKVPEASEIRGLEGPTPTYCVGSRSSSARADALNAGPRCRRKCIDATGSRSSEVPKSPDRGAK